MRAVLVLFALLFLGGCFSSPVVHFYVLASPEDMERSERERNDDGPSVAIMPVSLPGYLQRPQMVVRKGDDVDIRIEDLTMMREMRARNGIAMPLRTGAVADFRAQVDVRRFEGAPGEKVLLEAAWALNRDGQTLRSGVFRAEDNAGATMADMVEAESDLLEQLGTELARAVLALDAQERGAREQTGTR